MATTTYPYSGGTYNTSTLSQEIVAGGITLHTVRGTTAAIEVVVDSATVEATLNAIVTAHTGAATPPHYYPALTGGTTTYVRADGTLAAPVGTKPLVYGDGSVPAGNTIASTSSATSFLSSYTIPANRLVAGSLIEVDLFGILGTDVAAPTLILAVRVGGVVFVGTAAVTMTAGMTALGWHMRARVLVTAAGAGGTAEAHGDATVPTSSTVSQAVPCWNTSALALDTTATKVVDARAHWGTSHASNTITLHLMTVKILDPA